MVAAEDKAYRLYEEVDENPSAEGVSGTLQSLRIMGASFCLGAALPNLLFGLIVGVIATTFSCTPAAAVGVGVGAATCTAVITACIFYNVLTLRPAAEAEAQAAPQVMMR